MVDTEIPADKVVRHSYGIRGRKEVEIPPTSGRHHRINSKPVPIEDPHGGVALACRVCHVVLMLVSLEPCPPRHRDKTVKRLLSVARKIPLEQGSTRLGEEARMIEFLFLSLVTKLTVNGRGWLLNEREFLKSENIFILNNSKLLYNFHSLKIVNSFFCKYLFSLYLVKDGSFVVFRIN